jgi:hypothetical protein
MRTLRSFVWDAHPPARRTFRACRPETLQYDGQAFSILAEPDMPGWSAWMSDNYFIQLDDGTRLEALPAEVEAPMQR